MIRYVTDIDVTRFPRRACLLRIDLNTEEGVDERNFKLRAVVPTVAFLRERGARVIILSHRGRFGENPPTLRGFAEPLSKLLGEPVSFGTLDDVEQGFTGDICLVENLRFYAEEEGNDVKFAQKLANFGDFYVNEAFAVSHRQNASVTRICEILPHFGGLRLKMELEALGRVKDKPEHPFIIVLGGVKLEDKLRATEGLRGNADAILLGSTASSIDRGDRYVVPEDYVTDAGGRKLDIGERTRKRYADILAGARMIVWNGPMGLSQEEAFAAGTRAVWEMILRNTGADVVVGGGETVTSMRLVVADDSPPAHIFLSTGGGAMLAYLSEEEMPGLEALAL